MKALIKTIKLISLSGIVIALTGCATYQGSQGALLGTTVGGLYGAMIDHGNTWRGAVIGGGVGAAIGGTLGELSASQSGYPYRYSSPYRQGTRNSYPGPGYRGYRSYPYRYR